MKSLIMGYEKLTADEISKLESIERRIRKIDTEIFKLGFNVVQHAGGFQVIEGEPWDKSGKRRYECERYDISDLKCGWDTIDW